MARRNPSFEAQIILAVYRWERLRRDREYRSVVERWANADLVSIGPHGVVGLKDPFNLAVKKRYEADCAKRGLCLLFSPTKVISIDAMGMAPIFRDTPTRQLFPQEGKRAEERWQRVVGKLGDPYDLFAPGKVGVGPTLRHKHFRFKRVPPGPFQIDLPVQRVHLRVLRRGLEVFWLVEEGLSFRAIARRFKVSRQRVKTAHQMAVGCILRGTEALQEHWKTCQAGCAQGRIDQCDWMRHFGPPELRDRRWSREPEQQDPALIRRHRRRSDPLDRLPDPAGPAPLARRRGGRSPR